MTAARAAWLLAAVLALGVAVEVAWPAADAPTAAAAAAATVAAAVAAAEPDGAWAAVALARPLFNADRRPVAGPAASVATALRQEPPRLTGILLMPQGSHAIFAGDGDHATIAGEGTRLGAWQVVAIRAGEVQLSGPDGSRTVRPSYSNAPPAAVAAMPMSAMGLLPMPPQPDTTPFGLGAQLSGAAIFSNAPRSPAARTIP